jgi:hypothetical protein
MEEEKSKNRVLVVGATPNPSRYAYTAAKMFQERGFDYVPIGIKKGNVFGKAILDLREKPELDGIDTVTLYIGAQHQGEWMEYLLSLKPNRIIFNPGAQNSEFAQLARSKGIEVLNACNLVMLSTGQF